VVVAGSTVSRATLHNIEQIERLDLRLGDTIVIQKAGDVIPEVVEAIEKLRTGAEKKFHMPSRCPVCGEPVERRATGDKKGTSVALYCVNPNCPAKNRRGMQHFVNAFEIYEVGPKVLDRFQEEGLISDVADLFTLQESDIASLPRFGEKSAQNIVAEISQKKMPPLWRYIYALGILHVGEQTARDLAMKFRTLDALMSASVADLLRVENIGETVAESVFNFFHTPHNIAFIQKLANNGVCPFPVLSSEKVEGPLVGQTVVITGTLVSMSRKDAEDALRKLGARIADSVSKKTSFLVAGEDAGSKLEKANSLGVRVIGEEEFNKLIAG
jgi:DNA ligase (NAD+)